MTGRDHHFIPQLLQGISAGQTRKKKHQVWVFRRGKEPFKTSTLNSFVERDFYGPPSVAPVDQLITDEETKLDKFVADARASTATRSLSEEDLALSDQAHCRTIERRALNRIEGLRLADSATRPDGHCPKYANRSRRNANVKADAGKKRNARHIKGLQVSY